MGKTARGCEALFSARYTASGDPAMAHPSGMRTDEFRIYVRSRSGRFRCRSTSGRYKHVRTSAQSVRQKSAADIEPLDQFLVARFVLALDVIKQLTAR